MDKLETPKRRYCFPKKERLFRKKAFEYLFEHCSSVRVGVLRLYYILDFPEELSEAPVSVAFAAPKRNFKRAVDRNRIKRRLKEIYRLNKHVLFEEAAKQNKKVVFLVKYNLRKDCSYDRINRSFISALKILRKELLAS